MAVALQTRTRRRVHRVLIVEDHPMMRFGISRILESEPDLILCGEAENDHAALKLIPQCKPDVAVIDISLGTSDGLNLCLTLRREHPALPVIILSMHDELIYARKALRSGARGYVMKCQPAETLITAIHQVLDGEICVSEEVQRNVLHTFAGDAQDELSIVETLSNRERQVFVLMGFGNTTSQIAEKLALSSKTVDTHRARIKIKLGITSMPRLLLAAGEWVEHEGLKPDSSL